jgi:hypothetical protein
MKDVIISTLLLDLVAALGILAAGLYFKFDVNDYFLSGVVLGCAVSFFYLNPKIKEHLENKDK